MLQDLGYRYDLAGNILAILDRTPGCGVPPVPDALDRTFTYDPVYRLRSATGREQQTPVGGDPWTDVPRGTDPTQTQRYTETYHYDPVGNLLQLAHHPTAPHLTSGFTRDFANQPGSNRLQLMTVSGTPYHYTFDDTGNLISETTSRHFTWNHADRLATFATQTLGTEPSVHAHYLYNPTGERVVKLVRRQGNLVQVTRYVGGFEHHRWAGGANNHTHVIDDKQRIALVRTGQAHPDDRGPATAYQLTDHLGSSAATLDGTGTLINREEYTPYGETSFGSYALKRYRYTGQERDEESGLAYHSARYYLPPTARWAGVDPAPADIPHWSPYCYARDDPLRHVDVSGREPERTPAQAKHKEKPPVSGVHARGLLDAEPLTPPVPPAGLLGADEDVPGLGTRSAAWGARVIATTPHFMGTLLKVGNWFGRFGPTRALGDSLASRHMRLIFRLDRFSNGRFIWQDSYRAGRLRSIGRDSQLVALIDLGLRLVGAPEEVTDVTGLVGQMNAPSAVFAGYLSLGSSVQAIARYGWDAGPVIQHRNLTGKHTPIVQGLSLLTTMAFGSDEAKAEAAEMMTSPEARRGDYGPAVKLGRILHERLTSHEYTKNPFASQWFDDLIRPVRLPGTR